MSNAAVVYWSGTGNTEEMANQVAAGAKAAGADVSVFTSADFNADMVAQFDAIAFGCPSMGAEELEETEFAPMFDACEPKLRGKKSPYLVPMVGETVNGCVYGKSAVMTPA